MDAADIIDGCRLFGRLQSAARSRLAAMAQLHCVEAGTIMLRQGDQNPGIHVVGRGLVRVYKLSSAGKECVLHLAGPGATYAEAAVLGDFPCPAFAQTIEASVIAVLPGQDFMAFARDDHQACLDLMGGLAGWLRQLAGLLEDVVLRDATSRLARHLLLAASSSGQVELASSRKHIAAQLNLTPETLSRSLRRLDECGCISSTRSGIRVLARERLEEVAEGIYPPV